jgi:hypothetical protein
LLLGDPELGPQALSAVSRRLAQGVMVQASHKNAAGQRIWIVMSAGVQSIALEAGESVMVPASDLAKVSVLAEVSGLTCSYLGI